MSAWREVRNRRRSGNNITTFYVSNLPGGISNIALRNAFTSLGKVTDAYVARKTDVHANHFGFVRYDGVDNIGELLENMSKVKIQQGSLFVSVANYDRNENKMNQVTRKHEQDGRSIPTSYPPKTHQACYPTPVYAGKSYKEAIMNGVGDARKLKSLSIENNLSLYAKHCFNRGMIAEVNDINAFKMVRLMLRNMGFQILIVLKERDMALDFIQNRRQEWENTLSLVKIWEGQNIEFGRLACLKISGIPIYLRDGQLADHVCSLFEKVVKNSNFSWCDKNSSIVTGYIRTKKLKRTGEDVKIIWKKELSCSVGVPEDDIDWIPDEISFMNSD